MFLFFKHLHKPNTGIFCHQILLFYSMLAINDVHQRFAILYFFSRSIKDTVHMVYYRGETFWFHIVVHTMRQSMQAYTFRFCLYRQWHKQQGAEGDRATFAVCHHSLAASSSGKQFAQLLLLVIGTVYVKEMLMSMPSNNLKIT